MGVEPIRCHHQWILSPSRLPIPTHRRGTGSVYNTLWKKSRPLLQKNPRQSGIGRKKKNVKSNPAENQVGRVVHIAQQATRRQEKQICQGRTEAAKSSE